jgi:L-histidine N-alpha-methyltransferase
VSRVAAGTGEVEVLNLLESSGGGEDRPKIAAGLLRKPRRLPSRLFYDARGSGLFERITALEEYYLTRAEKEILRDHAPDLLESDGDLQIVELGSGDCSKVSILLDSLCPSRLDSVSYVPVDVSVAALRKAGCRLSERYPGLEVSCVAGDFCRHLGSLPGGRPRLFLFLGSTIGNLEAGEDEAFIRALGEVMEDGDRLLLGMDMVKDRRVLERAYNDRRGVTAEFNRNILAVTNALLKADFDPDGFEHLAFFNESESRIEMHLVARRHMEVRSPWLDPPLRLEEGERIHTESSRKYTTAAMGRLAATGGFEVRRVLTDSGDRFALAELIPEGQCL